MGRECVCGGGGGGMGAFAPETTVHKTKIAYISIVTCFDLCYMCFKRHRYFKKAPFDIKQKQYLNAKTEKLTLSRPQTQLFTN